MSEWREDCLSNVIKLIGGGTPKTSIQEYWGGDIPWISVKDFNNGSRYVYETEKCITKKGLEHSSTKILQKDDIIISARGTVGELAMIFFPMAFNQSCYGIRGKDCINQTFLYYLLKNSVSKLKKITHGSVFDTITRDTFDNITVFIPDIGIQKKIANLLSVFDDKIEMNNQINKNLEQQAQVIFSSSFGNYPKSGCLGDYCTVRSGYAFKSSWWQDYGIKVIKIGSINQDALDLSICSHVSSDKIDLASDFLVQGGDLLIALTGVTIGKFAMVPYIDEPILVNQRVGKFFLGTDPINRLPFIYCQLKQPDIYNEVVNRGGGSAQPNISGSDIMSMPCVIPEKDIILSFNDSVSPMFETIIRNQKENRYLANLRDTLLPKLMSGELDVSKLDI